ncbi:major facilitator superfamily domain-containing protein [Phlyctochytrium arcticum]|nr:major facilitator superfamily domain-containing protein [Phlyctochytrium arcticum]
MLVVAGVDELPPIVSLVLILIANFLFNVSFYIIIPTVTVYSESLGAGALFSGLAIGAVTLTSAVSLIPLTRIPALRDFYIPTLNLACISLIIGHLLYAVADRAGFLWLIFIGRAVNGLGFTGWLFVKRYCTDPRIVGLRRRTMCSALLVTAQTLGMVVGPLVGGWLARAVGEGNKWWNQNTVPGWIMAAVWTTYWIAVKLWFIEVAPNPTSVTEMRIDSMHGVTDPASSAESNVSTESRTETITIHHEGERYESGKAPIADIGKAPSKANLFTAFIMSYLAYAVFFELGAWEAYIPIYGKRVFEWSHYDAGTFIGVLGLGSFVLMLPLVFCARRLQDRVVVVSGFGIAAVGVAIHLAVILREGLTPSKQTLPAFAVAWFLVCWGFNAASTITLSLMSKTLPARLADQGALAVQLSNYMGRLTGALWGTAAGNIGDVAVVGWELTVVLLGVVFILGGWRQLRAVNG